MMQIIMYPIIGFGLGAFAVLFLYAWLEEREHPSLGMVCNPLLGLSTNYIERVTRTQAVMRTVCAYCRHETSSRYCRPCGVYYCLDHNTKAHAGCKEG